MHDSLVISGTRLINLFFFNDTATTEIYTLSLHDALPISVHRPSAVSAARPPGPRRVEGSGATSRSRARQDRKSTRLNSSHLVISYAVFCLKKKKNQSPTFVTVSTCKDVRYRHRIHQQAPK